MVFLIAFILLQSSAAEWESALPGFRFQVTQKGVDYGREVLLPILTDSIKTASIPDWSGRVDTPLGHIDVRLYSIKIRSVDISNTNVKIVPSSNIDVTIKSGSISMKAEWHYKEESWPHISDGGSLDMAANGITMTLDILVGSTSKGEPHVKAQHCSFHIGKLDVTFHGGASFLYNLFSDDIGGSIKDALDKQVCPLVVNELNGDLNDELNTLDLHTNIDEFCFIDYTLIQPPFALDDAIFINGKGEIYARSDPRECPSPKQELPDTIGSRMATLWVTEYLLNTAGWAYMDAGFLQYNLTNKDIPAAVPIKLNTDYFKFFVPELHQVYPDQDMVLWIQVTKPVLFHIDPKGVSGRAEGIVTWFVKDPDTGHLTTAFVVDAQVDLCVNVSVHLGQQSMIWLDVVTLEPEVQLKSSNIGNISVARLETFVKFCRSLLVPFANSFLKNGIPLPAFDNIMFSGFDFSLQKGYFVIHTDVQYTPSTNGEVAGTNHTLFDPDTFTCQVGRPDYLGSILKVLEMI